MTHGKMEHNAALPHGKCWSLDVKIAQFQHGFCMLWHVAEYHAAWKFDRQSVSLIKGLPYQYLPPIVKTQLGEVYHLTQRQWKLRSQCYSEVQNKCSNLRPYIHGLIILIKICIKTLHAFPVRTSIFWSLYRKVYEIFDISLREI